VGCPNSGWHISGCHILVCALCCTCRIKKSKNAVRASGSSLRKRSSGCMASALKVVLAFLHKLYSSGNHFKRFARRLALLLAFLGPRFSIWLRSLHRKSGTTRRKSTPIEPPSPRATASSRTVSRDSAGLRENLVACSTVPTLASVPNLQDPDRSTRQPATTIPSGGAFLPPGADSLTADHAPCLTSSPDERTPANPGSTSLSVYSSASDRRNIITHSLESLHASVDQPSRLSRTTHRDPGQGQDTSQSIERQFRSSPTDRLCQFPRPDIDISFDTHVDSDDRNTPSISPAVPPSLTSVVLDVHNSAAEPLPTSFSTNSQRLMDESYVIGSPPAHYPPLYSTAEESSQRLPPASLIMPGLPECCSLWLMHSNDVPRYSKDIKMQVNTSSSILPLHTYACLQTQREDILSNQTFNKNIPLVSLNTDDMTGSNRDPSSFQEQSHSDQPSLNRDCSPWVPATHPDGGLYFFDRERVRASVTLKDISHD
jgi:hypothetical protein